MVLTNNQMIPRVSAMPPHGEEGDEFFLGFEENRNDKLRLIQRRYNVLANAYDELREKVRNTRIPRKTAMPPKHGDGKIKKPMSRRENRKVQRCVDWQKQQRSELKSNSSVNSLQESSGQKTASSHRQIRSHDHEFAAAVKLSSILRMKRIPRAVVSSSKPNDACAKYDNGSFTSSSVDSLCKSSIGRFVVESDHDDSSSIKESAAACSRSSDIRCDSNDFISKNQQLQMSCMFDIDD